jgi:phosphopantetheinyl transferase
MVTAAAAKITASGSADALALLTRLVRERYDIALPDIAKTPAGKPFFPDRRDIFFSLSHTKSHVLAAVADAPVGADVETVRVVTPTLMSRVCTARELSQFDFLDLWVLKESYVKLLGGSLSGVFEHRFSRLGGEIIPPDGVSVCRLYGDVPDCHAAIITRAGALPDTLDVY